MNNLNEIKKFKDWKNSWTNKDSLGLIDYISFNIHPDDMLIIYNLFSPEFIEVEDCIFISFNYDFQSYTNLSLNTKYNKKEIEKTINRIHIYDIFSNCEDLVDEIIFENIGKSLQKLWSNKLKSIYPNRELFVDLIIDSNEYGPIITIYQK
jgi:hypothetical protein